MKSNIEKIDHVVVLMLENRSFDNLLGWLRHSNKGKQKVNGVVGKKLSNPIPPYANRPVGVDSIPVGKADMKDMTIPNPDPGEEYSHVNTQLYGQIIPDQNRYLEASKAKRPYNLPRVLPEKAPMNGFVTDYIETLQNELDRPVAFDDYKIIMDCFPEEAVPVMSSLAKEYAVFDAWFSSVPSQTLCNRSFMHAATSHGYVLNASIVRWVLHNSPTIFDRIEEKNDPNITWRVYYDKLDILSLTGLQNPSLWKYHKENFKFMDDFENDAKNGTLPSYAFIEPRFLIDHNDQHPPVGKTQYYDAPSVLAGEQLIERIYNMLKNGPKWENTLFIITYDEHGGCYDHIPPPAAVPPDRKKTKGEQGFKFDRLGIRVPMIMISPYIKKGTVISDVHDHTSIIKFICDRWGLDPLTERDKAATNFHNVLNRKTPDNRENFTLTSRPYHSTRATLDAPLNGLQKTVLYLLAGIEDAMAYLDEPHLFDKAKDIKQIIVDEERVAHVKTIGQAISFTIALDRRVTKHFTFWDWLKMKFQHMFWIIK